jgi:DNA processing protein
MDGEIRKVSTVMAALELLPAQPSDLTSILRDPCELKALLASPFESVSASELVSYLRDNLDFARIDWWQKTIDELIRSEAARPTIAGAPEYPQRLSECWDAPPVLFTTASFTDGPSIAIIGSRSTTDKIVGETREIAAALASEGVSVVSGLARGIDTAAHWGALDASGRTIAVMGTGITRVYPAENAGLAARIKTNGVLVSQFGPYAPRTRTTFLRRNHVIAGLSDVSLVMDGQARSGSRHEIEQAMNYGRPVLMWAGALAHANWALQLEKSGAASFVSDIDDIRTAISEARR